MESPPSGIAPLIPASPPPFNSIDILPSTPKRTLTALVVGIVLGGAFLLLFAVGVFVFFHKRRKRLLAQRSLLPTTSKQENPYGEQARYQLNVPPSTDDVVHQLPKSGPPPEVLSNVQSPQQQCDVLPSVSSDLGSDISDQARPPGLSSSSLPSTFTYEELASATDHFSSSNLLGQGGFGYVHKGVLPDGKEIAVKQLKSGSFQGEREFQAEVDTISRVHHRHLVSLIGHCIFGKQLVLVYEFIPNKTLEYHLHGKRWPPMSWETRLKIALGAAKGLAYLHEDCHPKIIHRDIKGSNILIDNEFEAKVADFGLAKFAADTDTHVSTRVMGTFGYLAPEYAASGKLTEKSDVYSFGVVLLELITGRRPVDKTRPFMDDSMAEWARPLLTRALERGEFNELVDQRLEEYDFYEMTQMIACAAACVRRASRRRPLMSQVAKALEGKLSAEDLLKEISPVNRTFHKSLDYDSNVQLKKITPNKRTFHKSLDYDSNAQFLKDLEVFRKLNLGTFESQEQSKDEYSGFTTEQSVLPSTSSTENQHDAQEIDTGNSRTGATYVFEIAID